MKIFTFIIISVLTGIELDLFIPSFPQMQKFFNISTFQTQLTLSVNFISYCVGALLIGWLGDYYPKKKVLLYGLCGFIVGSALCIQPFSFEMLLLGRAIQGFGVSAASILIPVLIADEYPETKQVHLFGVIHGSCAIAMSLAPIVGSYITLFFSWHANFITLFMCGILCLWLAVHYLDSPDNTRSHSTDSFYHAYSDCLRSKNFWLIGLVIWFATAPYWVFTGMAPLLYMSRMNVSLETFGIFQGSLALAFAIPSFFSGFLIKKFGRVVCFNFSWVSGIVTCTLMLIAGLSESINPIFVTCSFLPFSIGVVFIVNILYPAAISMHKNDKSKVVALLLAMRLLACSFFLQLAGYYGHQNLLPTTLIIVVSMLLAFGFIMILVKILPNIIRQEI